MKRRLPALAALLALASTAPALSSASFQLGEDCLARRTLPEARETHAEHDRNVEQTLSERLATCGSVLDPPRVGDPDIVESPPKTNDPINIHPEPRPGSHR